MRNPSPARTRNLIQRSTRNMRRITFSLQNREPSQVVSFTGEEECDNIQLLGWGAPASNKR